MSNLPAQVRKQSEHVQKLQAELTGAAPPSDPVVDPVVPPVDPNQSAAPPVQPVTQPVSDDFEQKYRTLQGMYNKEVPALRAEVQNLTNLLANLQAAPKPPAPAAPAPATTKTKVVLDSDVEQYGDAIEVMKRAAREEVAEAYEARIHQLESTIMSLTGKLDKEVVPAVRQVAETQAQYSDQEFWRDLTAAVPNWREINENEDFHTWLLETDTLSGLSRQTFLEDAHRKLDVVRVAKFFNEWQGPNQQQPPANKSKSSELDSQIAPGRAKTAPPPSQPSDQVVTREQVAKFYNDVASGKYRGRDDEKKKMEANIFAATREGRLR